MLSGYKKDAVSSVDVAGGAAHLQLKHFIRNKDSLFIEVEN